jgi:hypothetical protein
MTYRQPFASYRFLAEMAIFALHFFATRVMDRHAPTSAERIQHYDERRNHNY